MPRRQLRVVMGLMLVSLPMPAEHIQSVTHNGESQAGGPAFDQGAISDDDLSALAEFLSRLSLQDIGVELPPPVLGHVSQAWDALQAGIRRRWKLRWRRPWKKAPTRHRASGHPEGPGSGFGTGRLGGSPGDAPAGPPGPVVRRARGGQAHRVSAGRRQYTEA